MIDKAKCDACGGRCCKIYLSIQKGGSFPESFVDFPTHCDRWLEKFLAAGVLTRDETGSIQPSHAVGIEPLHDPHRPDLPTRFPWVDRNICQFCHPKTGCMIPRHQRPELCNRFMC